MAAQATKRKIAGKIKQMTEKIVHPPYIKTHIPAAKASAAPPLGTMLGQRGINITQFCKDFNDKTQNIKDGIPLQTKIYINSDRTYSIKTYKPPIPYLVKQAAGIRRAAMKPLHEISGIITLKHVYEIAKYKQSDENYAHLTVEQMCVQVINNAIRCGIKVIPNNLTAGEYSEFLKERKIVEDAQIKELTDKRQAKLMRSTSATATTGGTQAKK